MRKPMDNGDTEITGLPDDLRCKRSDGKQWRCTAMSMPDKTVCEKHYIQAKKRAANSALRASLKKLKRKPMDENAEIEDYQAHNATCKVGRRGESSAMITKSEIGEWIDDDHRACRTPSLSLMDESRHSQLSIDTSATTEHSDESSDSCENTSGQTCHLCNKKRKLTWCITCGNRGFCWNCIRTCFPHIHEEEIEKICPACRGNCPCKLCLERDNVIKARIQDIPMLDKLQYLYSLLISVLPVIKQIHLKQNAGTDSEKAYIGSDMELLRVKLNADEQMCCDLCRTPIVDYHRHCANCSWDLCLDCCEEISLAAKYSAESVGDHFQPPNQLKDTDNDWHNEALKSCDFLSKFPNWKVNCDGSIPCPPKEYGGCSSSCLDLRRIFKMNWITKLVKNIEEIIVSCGDDDPIATERCDCAFRGDNCGSQLYCPSSSDLNIEGIKIFSKHWSRGEPVKVRGAFSSSLSRWDPVAARRADQLSNGKFNIENWMDKVTDCFRFDRDGAYADQFLDGYYEEPNCKGGLSSMSKSKDWPHPNTSEELFYNRPEFIDKIPLLEYIHPRLGFINVAAKLPHHSLQHDMGSPKVYFSYGTHKHLDRDDSTTLLHLGLRDTVYLLVHVHKVKQHYAPDTGFSNDALLLDLPSQCYSTGIASDDKVYYTSVKAEKVDECGTAGFPQVKKNGGKESVDSEQVVLWDIFRRDDVPTLMYYLHTYFEEYATPDQELHENVRGSLLEGKVYLNGYHLDRLKETFGIKPWSIGQHLGEAIFIPAGCPFQARNPQPTVQLGLDFLLPQSVGEAASLVQEIRHLSNDHEAKSQVLEVGKMSLYAASWGIKEIEKLVLDPKFGSMIGFEDPLLTAAVADNLQKITHLSQISCA